MSIKSRKILSIGPGNDMPLSQPIAMKRVSCKKGRKQAYNIYKYESKSYTVSAGQKPWTEDRT